MFKYIFILILSIGVVSCSKYKDIKYHFTDLSLNHLDNTGMEAVVSQADSLSCKVYGIRLNLFPVIESETRYQFDAEKSDVINTNTITSVFITSTDSFDVNLPPGVCLNRHFIYYKNVYNTYDTIGCQSGMRPTLYYANNYKEKRVPDYADILLVNSPKIRKRQRFKITLTLKDGTVFSDSTSLIKLY